MSGRKNIVVTHIAVNQSMASSFTTIITNIKYLDNMAYQIVANTTDSIGSFTVEASVDYAQYEPTGTVTDQGNWVTLPIGGSPQINAASDDILIDMNQLPFTAIRIRYTASTPGTGTCNIDLIGKQLG